MSSLDEPLSAEAAELVDVLPQSRWERFDGLLARLSDRLNPILVKEARQALRSRQFTTTFFLMLAAGWTWSFLGLALLGPGAYYNAQGPQMFFVYYLILSAPLVVVIPYFAYQSLSSERHDRTYEMVSITALDAGRILIGKLCGIGLQMVVYLSALFPCLAFTYLLRGLDIFSVMLVVAYVCFLSLGLAMLGLLLAALSPPRQRQFVVAVLFAVFLCGVFLFLAPSMSMTVAMAGAMFESPEFWEGNAWMAVLYLNAFAILFLAARAPLTTASQNRSTALRGALLIAQLSFISFAAWSALRSTDSILYGLIFWSTVAWYLCGAFMMGEPRVLSPRVKRGLPQSTLGRALFSWFTPGAGTGYLFAISGMLTVSAMATLMATETFHSLDKIAAGGIRVAPRVLPGEIAETCVVATSYLVIYLGLGKLILSLARRFDEVRLTLRFLVHLLLVLAGSGIPWVIQVSNPPTRNLGYTLMQITNPMWTLWEYCVRNGPPAAASYWLVTVLPIVALVVWGFNLPSLLEELRQGRVAKPPRVAEDDAALEAATAPAAARTSPWDD